MYPLLTRHYSQEKKDGVIELHEVDPKVVEAMLIFFYTGDYDVPQVLESELQLSFHVLVYAAGEQFMNHSLKSHAQGRFKSLCGAHRDHGTFAQGFSHAVQTSSQKISNHPNERDQMWTTLIQEARTCLASPATASDMHKVMQTYPAFAQAMALNLASTSLRDEVIKGMVTLRCSYCTSAGGDVYMLKEQFLEHAAKKRKLSCLVCESTAGLHVA